MVQLAASYGLMSFALYTAAFRDNKWHSMARILACGTVICVGLSQFA